MTNFPPLTIHWHQLINTSPVSVISYHTVNHNNLVIASNSLADIWPHCNVTQCSPNLCWLVKTRMLRWYIHTGYLQTYQQKM